MCNFSFKQTEPVGSFRTILPISIEFYKQPEIQLLSWSLSISNLFKSLASTDCSYYRQCHKSSSSSKKQTWFGATVKCFQIRWRHFTLSVELQAFQACKSIFLSVSLLLFNRMLFKNKLIFFLLSDTVFLLNRASLCVNVTHIYHAFRKSRHAHSWIRIQLQEWRESENIVWLESDLN